MNINLLKLVCFIVTDGGIYQRRNQIYFDTTDDKLMNKFIETARGLQVKHIYVSKGHGTKTIYFYSKELYQHLKSLIGNEKTLPLDEMLRLSKKNIQEMLQILFSTDGGVSLSTSNCRTDGKKRIHRKVTFTSSNRRNLEIVKKLLQRFGVRGRIQNNGDLEIKGRRNLEKFKNLIGFIEGVKVTNKSKKWCGIEKNKLLDLCLKSYRYTHRE